MDSILITLINIVGGLFIGMFQNDMDFLVALETFTILTIGDGLVTAIPSLLISVAGGLITTRAATEASLAACRTFDVSPLFSTIALFSSKL